MTPEVFEWALYADKLLGGLFASWGLFVMFVYFIRDNRKQIEKNNAEWEKEIEDVRMQYRKMVDDTLISVGKPPFFTEKYQRVALPPSLRFDILQRDNFTCQICRKTKEDGERLEVDHKLPVSKGGTNDKSNLWTLCRTCNAGKSDKVVDSIIGLAPSFSNDSIVDWQQ